MSFVNEIIIFLLAIPLGMGVGSGGFFLVYLSDILSLARGSAVYLNLVFFLCALLASACIHLRERRIDLPLLGTLLLFGIPGAHLGYALSRLLPRIVLRLSLGLFLVGSGIFSFLSLKKAKDTSHSLDKKEKTRYNDL